MTRTVFVFLRGASGADFDTLRALGVKAGLLDNENARNRGMDDVIDGAILTVDTVRRAAFAPGDVSGIVAAALAARAEPAPQPQLLPSDKIALLTERIAALEAKAGIIVTEGTEA